MFDPCGTRHVDGEEILKRLAVELNTSPSVLRTALYIGIQAVDEYLEKHPELKNKP